MRDEHGSRLVKFGPLVVLRDGPLDGHEVVMPRWVRRIEMAVVCELPDVEQFHFAAAVYDTDGHYLEHVCRDYQRGNRS